MPTLKETLDQLTGLKHRQAVWEAIYAYLEENFVARDSSPPKVAIRAPNCSVEVVPEEVIEDVLQHIGEEHIKELTDKITDIEDQEIVVLDTKAQAQA